MYFCIVNVNHATMERTSDKFPRLRESALGSSTEQKADSENRPRISVGSVCEDYLTFDILKAYLADEEEDLFWSQGAVEMIEKIGAQNWLITQM